MSYFIANINELVSQQLQELELVPHKPLADFIEKKKRFYSTPCKTKNNTTVFLKILITVEKEPAALLKKEAELTRFLSQETKTGLNIPKFIDANFKSKLHWFIHEFWHGPNLGHHFELFQTGKKPDTARKIIKNLLALQSINASNASAAIDLPQRKAKQYSQLIRDLEKKLRLKKQDKKVGFKSIYQFFEKQKKHLNSFLVLSHGDFTLANFFSSKGKVYLTDWEWARIDNMAADIARMWIQTYRYPEWRKELIECFVSDLLTKQKKHFKELFRFMAVFEGLNELASDVLKNPGETTIKKVCKKTIKAGLKGFQPLLSI